MGCVPSKSLFPALDDDHDAAIVPSGSLLSNMVRETKNEDVFSKYEFIRLLGEGSMGSIACVRVRKNRKGGVAFQKHHKHDFHWTPKHDHDEHSDKEMLYALKTIQLFRISPDFITELRNEISLLRSLDHPNIVRLFEVWEKDQGELSHPRIYLVLELCSGGDLYKRTPYSEKAAANIVRQLLSAVKYLHDHDVMHRDLKFENIMFENNKDDASIKVIDFGLSKRFINTHSGRYLTEGVGTIYTMSPQVLNGNYDSQADMWSVGVISYMLLSDTKPFYGKKRDNMISRIQRCDYYPMKGPAWDHVSPQAKDFCVSLLQIDEQVRLNAGKALEHAWMSDDICLSERKPSSVLMDGVNNCLSQYRQTTALQRVARNIIAHRASAEEIVQLRKAFEMFDVSRDGVITYEEFRQGLIGHNYPEETIKEIFLAVDVNENGLIWFTEFLAACLDVQGRIVEERIAEAFDRLDEDGSGYISRKELVKILGKDFDADQIDQIIKETDVDGDGQISYEEFVKAFRTVRNPLEESMLQ